MIKLPQFLIILAGLILITSCSHPVTKPGYDFSNIHIVLVDDVNNYPGEVVSGITVNKALAHELMKMGLTIIDKNSKIMQMTGAEKATQSLPPPTHYDALFKCTIIEYQKKRETLVPVEIESKGSTTISTETEYLPLSTSDTKHGKYITHNQKLKSKTVKEHTVSNLGSITRTNKIITYDAVVSLNMQLVDANTGHIIWSSIFRYNALQLQEALEHCIIGGLSPLNKVMKPYLQ